MLDSVVPGLVSLVIVDNRGIIIIPVTMYMYNLVRILVRPDQDDIGVLSTPHVSF